MASSRPRRLYLPGVWCSSTRKRRHVTPCGSQARQQQAGFAGRLAAWKSARRLYRTLQATKHWAHTQSSRLQAAHMRVIVVEEVGQHLAAVIVGVDERVHPHPAASGPGGVVVCGRGEGEEE